MKFHLFLLSMILLANYSCRKDNTIVSTNDEFEKYTQLIESNALIEIRNEQFEVIPNVVLNIGDQVFVSNSKGIIAINKVALKNTGHIVTLKHPDYFSTPKRIYPGSRINRLTMIRRGASQIMDNQTGGKIRFSGVEYTFPANALVDASDQVYIGSAKVSCKFLDPTDPVTAQTMPGDLRAFDKEGRSRVLRTLGMVATEIFAEDGSVLQIAKGKTVHMRMDILPSIVSSAPSSIPTWSISDRNGESTWREEGIATKNGTVYDFEVSHFSFWNCDLPAEYVYLKGRLVDENQVPLSNATVIVKDLSTGLCGSAYTGIDGTYGGNVPKGVPLTFEVVLDCNGQKSSAIVYTQALNSLNADTDMGDIHIQTNTLSIAKIQGQVESCPPNSLGFSVIEVKVNGNFLGTYRINSNGFFNEKIPCLSIGAVIEIKVIDLDNLLESNVFTLTYNGKDNLDYGKVSACQNLDTYIKISYNSGPEETFKDTSFYVNNIVDSLNSGKRVHEFNVVCYTPRSVNLIFQYEQPVVGIDKPVSVTYIFDEHPSGSRTLVCSDCATVNFSEYDYLNGYVQGTFNASDGTTSFKGSFRLKRK